MAWGRWGYVEGWRLGWRKQDELYTLLTLKYGVNLLNAPVSSVLRQNAHTILTATGCVQTHFPIVLLWHTFYISKLSLTQIQKCRFLLLWNVSVHTSVLYVYELIFLVHTSRSTECSEFFSDSICSKFQFHSMFQGREIFLFCFLFMKICQAISKSTGPNIGLFVLILMYFVCLFQICNIECYFSETVENLM